MTSVVTIQPTDIPTSPPTALSPSDTTTLPQLAIAAIPGDIPEYDRADWKHWIDADSDCQNTRAEVLIAESVVSVGFRSGGLCTVDNGQWLASYAGTNVSVAGDLDIDHMVPLANAHNSGAWAWSAERKQDYANDLLFDDHLIAVTASANRSKGARGPEDWKPPDASYWCEYAVDWITIKAAWSLTATPDEWTALGDMLGTCTGEVVIETGEVPATIEPATPIPTLTIAVGGCLPGQEDVNTAATEDLELIVHIGPSRAAVMVELRPFSSLDDLTRISGISAGRMEDIKAQGIACVGS